MNAKNVGEIFRYWLLEPVLTRYVGVYVGAADDDGITP